MNPSRKGCQLCTIFFLALSLQAVWTVQTFADSPLPPQPGFDAYVLPPAPPKKIVEYTMLDPPSAEISGTTEKAAETVTAPLPEPAAQAAESPVLSPEPRSKPVQEAPVMPEPETLRVVAEAATQDEDEPDSTDDITPDLYARLNERFSLVLEGSSWLFIEAYPEGGIAYDGRMRDDTYMRFSFRALKNGTYILQFVQGGSGGGSGRTHRTAVEVLPEDEFVAKVTGASKIQDTEDESSLLPEEDVDDDLSREERYTAALDYLQNKQWEKAFRVLTDSGDFDPSEPSKETAAAYAAALFLGDYLLALDYANYPPSLQRDFVDSILNLGKELPVELKRRLLTGSLDLLPRFHGMDKLLFFLARDYEEPGDDRNIELSVQYYRYLLSEYPLSTYWQDAEQRANYLERHFLLLR